MSTDFPGMQNLAQRLLMYEAGHNTPSVAFPDEAVRVFEKLRVDLSKLMGSTGFRVLLMRALLLAKAEAPELGVVQVQEDGSLEGFEQVEKNSNDGAAEHGSAVLVSQFLGLLATFIGESLTLRLVHDIWPEVSIQPEEGKE
jgi:hypothetical protein